jgi:VIT1/CCC1 family predicted Fe2+/Mn2+ transporter
MPLTPHVEKHFTSGEVVRDVVIGMADGLTVPFALAAGLSGAVAKTSIIVTAGFAEIIAGSIAMGLGGYLAGKSDVEHYDSEYDREMYEIDQMLEHEKDESSGNSRKLRFDARGKFADCRIARRPPEGFCRFYDAV